MHILAVSDAYPAFDRSSYELRFSRFVGTLAKRHSVTLCPMDLPCMIGELGTEAVERYRAALHSSGITTEEEGLEQALRKGAYDLVLFVIYVQATPNNMSRVRHWVPAAKIVIDSVDVQFGRYLSRARLTGTAEDYAKADRIKREELAAYRAADFVITVSESERRMLLDELPSKPMGVIPNIHPLEVATTTEDRDHCSLVFVGWGKYDPNVDAVLYFARDVLPLILASAPHAKFKVIGSGYPEEVLALNGGAIEILGFVPETAPYLKSGHISVAPLRFGSGVKGKIGEALAHGIPVVTTSIGLEGFGLTPGENVLVGDTPAAFAEQVVNLLENSALHQRIGLGGWKFLEDTFSEEAVSKQIEAVFSEIDRLPQPALQVQWRKLHSLTTQLLERHVLWRLRPRPIKG